MSALRWIGIVLTVAGVVGFLTVADDFRHRGELIGVGTIFVLDLVFLFVSFLRPRR